jgi:hypothetical protein
MKYLKPKHQPYILSYSVQNVSFPGHRIKCFTTDKISVCVSFFLWGKNIASSGATQLIKLTFLRFTDILPDNPQLIQIDYLPWQACTFSPASIFTLIWGARYLMGDTLLGPNFQLLVGLFYFAATFEGTAYTCMVPILFLGLDWKPIFRGHCYKHIATFKKRCCWDNQQNVNWPKLVLLALQC